MSDPRRDAFFGENAPPSSGRAGLWSSHLTLSPPDTGSWPDSGRAFSRTCAATGLWPAGAWPLCLSLRGKTSKGLGASGLQQGGQGCSHRGAGEWVSGTGFHSAWNLVVKLLIIVGPPFLICKMGISRETFLGGEMVMRRKNPTRIRREGNCLGVTCTGEGP